MGESTVTPVTVDEGSLVKLCRFCGQTKPVSDFGRHVRRRDEIGNKCKQCLKAMTWKHRGIRNFTVAMYNAMLQRQRNRCAVCRRKECLGKSLAVDHDHVTGQVRGLLCSSCNRGLGYFSDDPKILRAALQYVEANRQMPLF